MPPFDNQRARAHSLNQHAHAVLRVFSIVEHVAALLRVDARYAEPRLCIRWCSAHGREVCRDHLQQIALKPQGHWRIRRYDRLARFCDVNIEDGFARDFLESRLRTESCDEPSRKVVSMGQAGARRVNRLTRPLLRRTCAMLALEKWLADTSDA